MHFSFHRMSVALKRKFQLCCVAFAVLGASTYFLNKTDHTIDADEAAMSSHRRLDGATYAVRPRDVVSRERKMARDENYERLSPHEKKVLGKMHQRLKEELLNYTFHPAVGAEDAVQLTPKFGGHPVMSMVVTTWRSGSTFVGDLLTAHPAVFYQYEPLLDFEITRPRHGSEATRAQRYLSQLLKCNYTKMERYLEYGKTHPWLFSHNKFLWPVCSSQDLCQRSDFLSHFCALFPIQVVKTVRMPMNLTEELLRNKELDLRVLLLVRDPRATMQSRKHRDWCRPNPECWDPAVLCADLVSDYLAAQRLTQLFPGRVRVMRYEDLSLNLDRMTRQIFDFFRLSYVESIVKFLSTHTTKKSGGVSSTFRDSSTTPFHWQKDLTYSEVDAIQSKCHRAMDLFKYRLAHSEANLQVLQPLGNFTFSTPGDGTL